MNKTLLTEYEKLQIKKIEAWKRQEPSVASKVLKFLMSPLNSIVKSIIPDKIIMGALSFSNTIAEWLTDKEKTIKRAEIKNISDLKSGDLQKSDLLADRVHNWAMGEAGLEGGVTGAMGYVGMAIDIPWLITLSLRTINQIGLCYGFEVNNQNDRDFLLSVLMASSSSSMEEKVEALLTLKQVEKIIANQTWKAISAQAHKNMISKETGLVALKKLANIIGINLSKRKALQAIPIIGSAIGLSINVKFLKDVGWAARYLFQERWLLENNKINDLI